VNTDDLRDLVLEVLSGIAPETDPSSVDPTEDLRDELDLDSMDELNLITRVGERLGIDIPERDYRQMRTLDGAVDYLSGRLDRRVG
jgi:acyl carrier protein